MKRIFKSKKAVYQSKGRWQMSNTDVLNMFCLADGQTPMQFLSLMQHGKGLKCARTESDLRVLEIDPRFYGYAKFFCLVVEQETAKLMKSEDLYTVQYFLELLFGEGFEEHIMISTLRTL